MNRLQGKCCEEEIRNQQYGDKEEIHIWSAFWKSPLGWSQHGFFESLNGLRRVDISSIGPNAKLCSMEVLEHTSLMTPSSQMRYKCMDGSHWSILTFIDVRTIVSCEISRSTSIIILDIKQFSCSNLSCINSSSTLPKSSLPTWVRGDARI